jgi:hypothetical protein
MTYAPLAVARDAPPLEGGPRANGETPSLRLGQFARWRWLAEEGADLAGADFGEHRAAQLWPPNTQNSSERS